MRKVKRAAALAAVLSCITAVALPGAAAARTRPAAPAAVSPATLPGAERGQSRPQVNLALTTVTPNPVTAQAKVRIAGTAENRSGHQLAGLTVRLRYGTQPMTSRGQLDQYATWQPSQLPNVSAPKPLARAAAAGGRENWGFGFSATALRLRGFGVYPIGVEVLNSAGQAVGGVTTFITFMPKQRVKPVAVSWVWPLIDRQHRSNDRTFIDDRLSKDLAEGGRLHDLVSAAKQTTTPITWSIDPALVDDVQQMTRSYTVKAPRAKQGVEKKQSPAAASWLAALKEAAKTDPYAVVPYGDPDAIALVRNEMTTHLAIASDPRNTGIVSSALSRQPTTQMAWPTSGAAGQLTLNALAKLNLKGGGSFLMSSSQFQEPAQGALANAMTTLPTSQGAKKAIVYDEKINEIVSGDTRTPGTAVLTEQRFLAETAMIAAEAPNAQRTLVVAPNRHWNPTPGLAKRLLDYTARAPWMNATALDKIARTQPQARQFNGYPEAYQQYELGISYLDMVQEIARRASSFAAVLVDADNLNYQRSVLRLESAAWRGRPGRAKQARQAVSDELNADMGRVRVITPPQNRVAFAGSSGKFPVTIVNDLPNQRIKVQLDAVSENSAKLRIGTLDAKDREIILDPGQKVAKWIPAQASGNGNFRVHLQLMTSGPKSRKFGDGETLTVRTTGYGRLALLITGGGLAVLFVGVGVRAVRARRRRNTEAADEGSTGAEPAATGPQGGPFPGSGMAGPGLSPGTEPGLPLPGAPDAPGATRAAPDAASTSGVPGAAPAGSSESSESPGPSGTAPDGLPSDSAESGAANGSATGPRARPEFSPGPELPTNDAPTRGEWRAGPGGPGGRRGGNGG
ncbi:DUF6049 family protein [Actinomadura xylanilytica]|uniref:DUF6049 family protein n=1 Tax=Actinomadura xylanilytica TaxID=887459 RepID=UPI00255ADE3F|nr:DUF6049 family protein [Actinomadura xylanilytica]MDL4773455.1 DUF6049 family protein [Actinomadura xylanilytica]